MSIKIEAGLNMNNAEGDVQAGLAIHRLGDLYAHTEIVTGMPFLSIIGHLFEGKLPDQITMRPGGKDLNNLYSRDLAETIAKGAGKDYGIDAINKYVKVWNDDVVGASRNEDKLLENARKHYSGSAFTGPASPELGTYGETYGKPLRVFSDFHHVRQASYKEPDSSYINYAAFTRGYDAYLNYFKK